MAAEVSIVMRMRDLVSGPLRRLEENMGQFKRQVGKSMDATLKVGAGLTAALTVPTALAGREILRTSALFEEKLNLLGTLSGATGAEMVKLSGLARRLGADTMYSASDAAEAMGVLAQSGYDVNEIYTATPQVLNLAAASAMTMAEAAETLSDAMASYGITADKLAGVNDTFARTANLTSSSVASLREAFRYAGPAASLAGISFEKTASMLGLIHQGGIKGTMAGTSFAAMLSRMADAPREAQQVWRKFGFKKSDLFDAKTGKVGDLTSILAKLDAKGATLEDLTKLFGIEGARAAGSLMKTSWRGKKGAAALGDLDSDLGVTSMAANLREALGSLKSPTEEAKAAMAELGISAKMGADEIFRRLKGASDAQLSQLFVSGSGAQTVRAAQGSPHTAGIEERLRDSGDAAKFAESRGRGLAGAMRELSSAWEELQHVIAIDSGLMARVEGAVRGLTEGLNRLSEGLKGLPSWQVELGVGLAAAAVAVGPLLVGIGLAGKALTAAAQGAKLFLAPLSGLSGAAAGLIGRLPLLAGLFTPVGMAVAAATAAFGLFALAGEGSVSSVLDAISGFMDAAPQAIEQGFSTLFAWLDGVGEKLPGFITDMFSRAMAALDVAIVKLPEIAAKVLPIMESVFLGLARLAVKLVPAILSGLAVLVPKVFLFLDRLSVLLMKMLWANIKVAVGAVWALIKSVGIAVGEGISSLVVAAGEKIAGGVMEIANVAKTKFQEVVGEISDLWEKMMGGIGKAIDFVLGKLGNLGEGAKGIAKEVGSLLGLATPAAFSLGSPANVQPAISAVTEARRQEIGGEIAVGVSFANVPTGTKIQSQSQARGPITLNPRLGIAMAGAR